MSLLKDLSAPLTSTFLNGKNIPSVCPEQNGIPSLFRSNLLHRSNWEEQIASEKVEMSNNIEACKNTGNYSEIIFLDDYQAMASNYCTNVADAVVATDSIETEKRFRYVITYAILMAVALYAYIHRTFAFFSVCLKASTKLHDNLFRGVTRATMQFFNRNPSGRILNRFSRDINSIDIALPPALIECLSVSFINNYSIRIASILCLLYSFFLNLLP